MSAVERDGQEGLFPRAYTGYPRDRAEASLGKEQQKFDSGYDTINESNSFRVNEAAAAGNHHDYREEERHILPEDMISRSALSPSGPGQTGSKIHTGLTEIRGGEHSCDPKDIKMPFPPYGGIADVFRPCHSYYESSHHQAWIENTLASRRQVPQLDHLDSIKTWRGLCSQKAEELLYWEDTFNKVIRDLLQRPIELLYRYSPVCRPAPRPNQPTGNQDAVQYFPVDIVDIATAMVSHAHRSQDYGSLRWFPDSGNIYTTVADFVQIHNLFTTGHGPDGLHIGVRLKRPGTSSSITTVPTAPPLAEIIWNPDYLSFDSWDYATVEGEEFLLRPHYVSPSRFHTSESGASLLPIVYTTSARWLRWDPHVAGFTGIVPFFSDAQERSLHPDANIIPHSSDGDCERYMLRVVVKAMRTESFHGDVRYEQTIRARITMNISRRPSQIQNRTSDNESYDYLRGATDDSRPSSRSSSAKLPGEKLVKDTYRDAYLDLQHAAGSTSRGSDCFFRGNDTGVDTLGGSPFKYTQNVFSRPSNERSRLSCAKSRHGCEDNPAASLPKSLRPDHQSTFPTSLLRLRNQTTYPLTPKFGRQSGRERKSETESLGSITDRLRGLVRQQVMLDTPGSNGLPGVPEWDISGPKFSRKARFSEQAGEAWDVVSSNYFSLGTDGQDSPCQPSSSRTRQAESFTLASHGGLRNLQSDSGLGKDPSDTVLPEPSASNPRHGSGKGRMAAPTSPPAIPGIGPSVPLSKSAVHETQRQRYPAGVSYPPLIRQEGREEFVQMLRERFSTEREHTNSDLEDIFASSTIGSSGAYSAVSPGGDDGEGREPCAADDVD